MKRKLLLACSLSALLSINCYALEIHNGHLINHKEWTTGGAKMFVKDGVNQHAQMLNKKKTANGIYTSVFNSINPNKGIVGTPIDIKSTHQVYVLNDTEQTHQYNYTLGVCAQVENHRDQCGYYFDSVELQPGGYVSTNEQPFLQITVNKAGDYEVNSFTTLGQNEEVDNSYFNTGSSAILNVAEK